MSNKYEENHTPTAQSSLAGGKNCQEEKLLCGKRTELQRKYKLISNILVGIIIMATAVLILSYDKCKVKGHVWSSATCTDPQRCTVCDVTEGSPLGHSWIKAACEQPKMCTVCNVTDGTAAGHSWVDATCIAPKTCSVCYETVGDLAAHIWNEATCTASRFCDICGTSEGSPLGHSWQNATCTEAETCTTCGEIQGTALGHDWKAATFLEPKTCMRCGGTEGTSISYAGIDIENRVREIRTEYNDIMSAIETGVLEKHELKDGVVGYYDINGTVRCIVAYRGTGGIGQESSKYSRSYYYHNGKLIFAFFEGSDSHRLYFYEELLMRWLYRVNGNSVYHDFDFTDRYLELERLAKEESWLYQ